MQTFSQFLSYVMTEHAQSLYCIVLYCITLLSTEVENYLWLTNTAEQL